MHGYLKCLRVILSKAGLLVSHVRNSSQAYHAYFNHGLGDQERELYCVQVCPQDSNCETSLKAMCKGNVPGRRSRTWDRLWDPSHLIMRHMCATLSYPHSHSASIKQGNCAGSCCQADFSLPKAVSHGNLGPAPLGANSLANHVCLFWGRVLSLLCFCSKERGGISVLRGIGEQARQVCRILLAT